MALNNKHLHSNTLAPVLSQPYLHLQDAIDCAPERALILLDVNEGTYQFTAIGDEHTCYRHVRALVNGIQFVTDLCAVAYNMGDGWGYWE